MPKKKVVNKLNVAFQVVCDIIVQDSKKIQVVSFGYSQYSFDW